MPPQNTQPGFDPNVSLPKEKRHLSGILTTVILVVLLLAALGFGIWAFMERQDYKNNVDSKISEAVAVAEEKNSEAKEAEFAEREKNPLKTYQGPATFGSVGIKYPKTWSAFITESDSDGTLIDGYKNTAISTP